MSNKALARAILWAEVRVAAGVVGVVVNGFATMAGAGMTGWACAIGAWLATEGYFAQKPLRAERERRERIERMTGQPYSP